MKSNCKTAVKSSAVKPSAVSRKTKSVVVKSTAAPTSAPVSAASALAPNPATIKAMEKALKEAGRANGPEKRQIQQSFFKTGPGEYGEGDVFYGATVPQSRAIAKQFAARCTEADWVAMLHHTYHEMRFCALVLLKTAMQQALRARDNKRIEACYTLYKQNTAGINNWDLVDLSAPDVVGQYALYKGKPEILYQWAKSQDLWEQRIAMVGSFAFICAGESAPTFRLVDMLMQHPHDLIHKACGWMLREVGKRLSEDEEYAFLIENDRFKRMPRTMLRYAIERFPAQRRFKLMQK